jgi:beta-glucosidase
MGAKTVLGIQESVIATAKHFILNEQETDRNPNMFGFGNASVSSNIDDKTMHEYYLWPFQDAVKAGVGSVMCSYQRVNGSHSCQNSWTQNGLLKTELGFQGYIISDYNARWGGIASTQAGMDLVTPPSAVWPQNLTVAVENGTLAESRLDDMVIRQAYLALLDYLALTSLQNPYLVVQIRPVRPGESARTAPKHFESTRGKQLN